MMAKKLSVYLVVVLFFTTMLPSRVEAGSRRRNKDASVAAAATVGVIGALGLIFSFFSRQAEADRETSLQKYQIDAATTIAGPSALGDRESSDWDRPKEGRARIYSPFPVPVGHVASPAQATSPEDKMTARRRPNRAKLPDLDELGKLKDDLSSYKVTTMERRAFAQAVEEVGDRHRRAYSKNTLRYVLDGLYSIKDKILDGRGAPVQQVAALEILIRYLEVAVHGKEIS